MNQVTSGKFSFRQAVEPVFEPEMVKRAAGRIRQMNQQLQSVSWRGRNGERVWLAALIDAMEEAAQPGRNADGDSRILSTLRAQLALPARPHVTSPFSLRN